MIDVRQLRYFVAVAEERHFGRAAARLNMAQPPLSQQIRQLERQLGAQLLVRTTRKVELTAAGELLLVRGRRIIGELNLLEDDVKRVHAGLQGLLRVGFTGAATYGIMPRVVREAAASYPGLALDVTGELLTPALVAALRERRVDVALLRPPVGSADIECRIVAHEDLVVALQATSSFAEKDSLSWDELAAQTFVGYLTESVVTHVVAEEWRRRGHTPTITQTVAETSTLISLVAAGIGMAFVPRSATALALRGVVFRPLDQAPSVDLALAWRHDDASPVVRTIIPFLGAVIRDIPETRP
jgi:DNA-binding transcriptional LysR family regulator